MANKLVNLRLSTGLLTELDRVVRDGIFASRTEFIKEAVRAKLDEYRTQQAIKSLRRELGMGKRMGIKEPTEEEWEKVKEATGERLLKRYGLE